MHKLLEKAGRSIKHDIPSHSTSVKVHLRFMSKANRWMPAQADDRYEREADRAADQALSSKSLQNLKGEERISSPFPRSDSLSLDGEPLDMELRRLWEPRFGHSFANVRVHTDQQADESARRLGARAYTFGEHIRFARGEYQPSSREGQKLLAHELAHVVQQSRTPRASCARQSDVFLSKAPSPGIQPKLIATGDSAGFVALANSIIAVQFEVRVSAAGEVSIHSTSIQGPPTRDAQELLRVLRMIINDPQTTTIEFIRGATSRRASDRNVIVGSYALSRVDLDDVEAFGMTSSHSREGDNAAVQLVHELTEQYRKQVHGESFDVAHRAGYAAQERLLGARLINETPMTPIGGDLGEVTTTYRYPDGREVDVITRMNFRTGQIVSVRRVIR
jgi:hypothetical protein